MNQSEGVDLLFAALVKVQSELKGAKKDSENPFFKSSYADLESCWSAAREPLAKNGLCVIQTTGIENNEPGLYTTLGHVSGQWMRGFLPLNMKAKDPQGQGSAITYARRYAFAAIIGIIQVDDDGESAMDRGPQGKGMIPPGNGLQKEGPRLGTLPKDIVDKLGANPSGKLIEDLHRDVTHKLIGVLEEKYNGKEMPVRAAEMHAHLIDHAMEFEKGPAA